MQNLRNCVVLYLSGFCLEVVDIVWVIECARHDNFEDFTYLLTQLSQVTESSHQISQLRCRQGSLTRLYS